MRKLAKDKNALNLNDKPTARLLDKLSNNNDAEELHNSTTKGKEMEEKDEEESPGSNTIKHNQQRIIPFSEFMKEKVKAGYSIPTKIPIPSKSPSNRSIEPSNTLIKKSARSPKIESKFVENMKASEPKNMNFSATIPKNPAQAKYFASLKNKFSPLAEINELKAQKAKVIEFGVKKKGTRQPNQQHLKRKYVEEPSSPEAHYIKSEEESKKNIIKVAGKLKKKLKHNFNPNSTLKSNQQFDEESEEEQVWESSKNSSKKIMGSPKEKIAHKYNVGTRPTKLVDGGSRSPGSSKYRNLTAATNKAIVRPQTSNDDYEDKKEIAVQRKYNYNHKIYNKYNKDAH